jgi:TolB-like protein
MSDAPPALPAKVPSDLRAVIVRCLAHDPVDRFERASDVVTALEACVRGGGHRASRLLIRRVVLGVSVVVAFALIASAWYQRRRTDVRPEVPTASVAVLPFTVLSGSPEIGFLAIGVPDRIISRISVVRGLRVRAMLDNTQGDNADSVGRRLGVDYVLTGTIQQSGTEVRITPRLMRVTDSSLTWTNAYTLPSGDLLRLQDDIATGVVEALPVRMTSEDRARVDRQYARSADAYELYLRGRALLSKNAPDTTLAAVNSFRSALDHDPYFVLAHAGIAVASARMGLFHANEEEVQAWHTQARQAALRALQLGPDLAQSHEAMAAVFRSTEFEWEGTIDESTRALERNQGLDQPHLFRASAFLHLGLLERVASETKAAMDRNPASLDEPLRVQGVAALYNAQPDAAVRLLEEASNKNNSAAEWNLAYAYYNAGQGEKAEEMLRVLAKSYSARTRCRAQATLASILAATDRQSQATELVDAVLGSSCMDHHVAYSLGAAYAQLRRTQEAMTWLERATERGFRCYPWFDKDPLLAPLRRTKVFQRFVDELRQSWLTRKAQFRTVQSELSDLHLALLPHRALP